MQAVILETLGIARVRAVMERWGARLEGRVFQPGEIAYCRARRRCDQHQAARLAAKLGARRLLGGGALRDIEVVIDAAGAPSIVLHGRAAAIARLGDRLGDRRLLVSLSHDGGLAVALVVLTGGGA